MNLVAIVCLIVAAKMEETDANIPRYHEMHRFVVLAYCLKDYVDMERKILDFFDFNLTLPTAPTFLDYYMPVLVNAEDFEEYKKAPKYQCTESLEELKASMVADCNGLLDLTLMYPTLVHELPSRLAAGIVAVSRIHFGLCHWNDQLARVVGEPLTKLHHMISHLITIKSQNESQVASNSQRSPELYIRTDSANPDSGYLSYQMETEESGSDETPLSKKPKLDITPTN